jgi:hypothetical protein
MSVAFLAYKDQFSRCIGQSMDEIVKPGMRGVQPARLLDFDAQIIRTLPRRAMSGG